MKRIDLNCDMGESFGPYNMGMDAEAIRHITSANVACGWHAGDPAVMDRTVWMAKENGVAVGAHPGYPDRHGFGRRNMEISEEELRQYVIYQVGALQGFCRAHGLKLNHLKPHGALYLTSLEDERVARAVAEAAALLDAGLYLVTLAGPKGELMARIGAEAGLNVIFEAFPDRAYTPEGTLVSRKVEGAVIIDPAEVAARALMMAEEGRVIASDGSVIELEAQTLCVHGDTPDAVQLLKSIRRKLEAAQITVEAARGEVAARQ